MICLEYSRYLQLLLFLTFSIFTLPSNAEQKVALGTWDVHYMALNSTFLTPQVAQQYGIVRSKFNGVINVSVLDKQSQKAQSLVVSGQAKNLLGVVKELTFKEVQEGEAIYYLAVLSFSDQERYRITLGLNDGSNKQEFTFEHKFYAE